MHSNKLQEAEQLLQKGDLQSALACYQAIHEESPNNADILHIIGMLQAKLGLDQQALTAINQAIQAKPNFAPFYNSKGNVLLRLQRMDEALAAYQQSVKIQPNYAIGYNSLGRLFYQQDKLTAAQKSYQQAITINPNLIDAHYNYGVLLTKLGAHEQALAELNKVLSLGSQHRVKAHSQIAQIYLQQQKYPEAITHLQKLLRDEPHHEVALFDLALAYLENNELIEAKNTLEKLLLQNHQHPECNHYLATAYLQMGDREKALNYFFRQLEINPLPSSYYNIGVLLMYQERHKEAITYFNQAADLEPGYLPTHLNLGALYLKLGATQQAIKHYEHASRIQPNDAEIQHILTALLQDKTPEKAPSEYLQHLFDQYATHYDKHLIEYLNYKVPQQLHKIIYDEIQPADEKWFILDLGCGTGLCGELFKEFAKKIVGIDLSQQMIHVAESKQIYSEFKVADISDALDDYHDIDLILAADVFTYIGNLAPIFEKVARDLKPKGLFAFSVEKGGPEDYKLQQSIRYAHSRPYLESLIKSYQFETLRLDNIILRKQKQQDVEGYIVLLQKKNVA